jgi:hypothetical protein
VYCVLIRVDCTAGGLGVVGIWWGFFLAIALLAAVLGSVLASVSFEHEVLQAKLRAAYEGDEQID